MPPEIFQVKNQPVCSSRFGFGKDSNSWALASNVPKTNKDVLMLSTLHYDEEIDVSFKEAKKPDVIKFNDLHKKE